MIRAIILDDEQNARELLAKFVEQFCPNVEVVANFGSPTDAYLYLSKNHKNVDLIYLDISMPQMDGLSFLKICLPFNIRVIFITAHDQYAIQAIRLSAIDYILKPIDINLLVAATQKAVTLIADKENSDKHIQNFIENQEEKDSEKKISINAGSELLFVKVKDIICLEADGNYTAVYCINQKKVLVTERLGEFEETLNYNFIFRVHRGFLINLYHVQKYLKARGGSVIMSNGMEVPVSQRNKTEFLKYLNNI